MRPWIFFILQGDVMATRKAAFMEIKSWLFQYYTLGPKRKAQN